MKPIELNCKSLVKTSNDMTYATPDGKPCSDLGVDVRGHGGAGRRHVNHKAADCRPVCEDQVCMRVLRRDSLLASYINDCFLLLLFEPNEFTREVSARFLRQGEVNEEAVLDDIGDPAIELSEFAEKCDDALPYRANYWSGDQHLKR
jgi:hypothetical protein